MMIPRLRPAFWLFCIFVFSLSLVVTPAFSASVCYTYDVRHRLTHVAYDNGAVVQYSYDATGNRLTTSSSLPVSQTYEDAEDGNVGGWDIYDNDPAGATVTNVFDDERAGKVILFLGLKMERQKKKEHGKTGKKVTLYQARVCRPAP